MKQFVLFIMAAWIAAIASPAVAATQPTATERAALMKPVNAWVKAFDTHDVRFPSNAFTDDCVIIDDFAPFAWAPGTTPSVRQWYARVVGADDAKRHARIVASKEDVVVGDPDTIRISGDLAYLTFHAYWSALFDDGKRHVEHGLFIVVERRTASGWLMSANSWGILR